MSRKSEVGASFDYANRINLVPHAKFVQDWQIARQQRFTDVKTRMLVLLEKAHPPALTAQ
jgi:hypothetical protein